MEEHTLKKASIKKFKGKLESKKTAYLTPLMTIKDVPLKMRARVRKMLKMSKEELMQLASTEGRHPQYYIRELIVFKGALPTQETSKIESQEHVELIGKKIYELGLKKGLTIQSAPFQIKQIDHDFILIFLGKQYFISNSVGIRAIQHLIRNAGMRFSPIELYDLVGSTKKGDFVTGQEQGVSPEEKENFHDYNEYLNASDFETCNLVWKRIKFLKDDQKKIHR